MSSTFSHTVGVSVSPGRIWEALEDAATWSNIGPIEEVWDAEHGDDGTLIGYHWSARAAGRSWKGTATRAGMDPERHMRLDLESSEITGAITVQLGDAGITVTMEAAPRGFLAQMFWGTVKGALEKGLPHQVEAFARSLE